MKPTAKPKISNFSSGPCAKRPGYKLENLSKALLGRSHRSSPGKARLAKSIEETRRILGIPSDYLVGIVPASDTGAMEMSLWSMLGPKPVDVFYWESFGKEWADDIEKQLKLPNTRVFKADYGKLPDLKQADFSHDVVFVWNGTTSGVKIPNGDWIPDNRDGLAICDATSAVYAMTVPWKKLDVITFSWQKVLGGEAAHGILVLSPRAVKRLESYTPPWPLPKIFRMAKKGEIMKEIFEGSTINTPSMLCNEDYLDALAWADSIGGLDGLMKRSNANLAAFEKFVDSHSWIHFLASDKVIRSNTSVCFSIDLTEEQVKAFVKLLDKEDVAHDCGAYKNAPPGLRFWCGATVETSDIELLLPWLEWAYEEVKKSQ